MSQHRGRCMTWEVLKLEIHLLSPIKTDIIWFKEFIFFLILAQSKIFLLLILKKSETYFDH